MRRLAVLVLVACGSHPAPPVGEPVPGLPAAIPLDPAVARGRLANGIAVFAATGDHDEVALVVDETIETAPSLTALRTLADRHADAARLAVIVLGKADPHATVEAVEHAFGSLARPRGVPRPLAPVPAGPLRVEVATDHRARLAQRYPHRHALDEPAYRAALVELAAREIILARVRSLAATTVDETTTRIDNETDEVALSAIVFTGGDKLAAEREGLMYVEEIERLHARGVTAGELEAWRVGHRRPPTIAALASYARGDLALPSPADEARLAATVTLDALNAAFHAIDTEHGRVLHLDTPSSEEEVRAREAEVRKGPFEAWEAKRPIASPRAGTIASEQQAGDLTVFALGNGARVILQAEPTYNALSLVAMGPGGWTRVPAGDEIAARVSATVALHGSFGDFDAAAWKRVMRGRGVSIDGGVAKRAHFVRATWNPFVGAPHDVDALYATMHLALSRPRADRGEWAFWRTTIPTQPHGDALFDAKRRIDLAHGDASEVAIAPADLDAIDLDRAVALYLDQVGDIATTTFVITGPTTAAAARPFIEKYLASLAPVGKRIAAAPRAIAKVAWTPTVVTGKLVVDYLGPVVPADRIAEAEVDLLELESATSGPSGMRISGGITAARRPNLRLEFADPSATAASVQHMLDQLAATGGTEMERAQVDVMKRALGFDSLMLSGVERGDDLVALATFLRTRLAQPVKEATLRAQAKLFTQPFAVISPR